MNDKIVFWIEGDLLCYCLAYYLQKNYDSDFFAIIDVTNKPRKFFAEQKFVKFEKIWFYHDYFKRIDQEPDVKYLSSFEEKYNIKLWELAINERIFYRFNRFHKFSKTEILKILEVECKLFEEIIEEINPNFLITFEPSFHHHELFYELCKVKGVKILMLNQPNFKKCVITSQTKKLNSYEKLENVKGKGRDFVELRKYLHSVNVYEQAMQYQKKFTTSKSKLMKAAFEFIFKSDNSNMKTHYTYYGRTKLRVLLDSISNSLKEKYRKKFIDKNLLKNVKLSEKFVYFPLAVDEERNLLLATPFYTNQIEVIRHIVKSLPVNYTLYVKETPGEKIRGWRSISEYKEILNIPNVKFFHPSISSKKLLENCSLVISIGGSSGFEAAFYQKPSIIFSDLGYAILPSVQRVTSIEQLSYAIRDSLKKTVNSVDLDKYVTLLEEDSFEFDLFGFFTKCQHYFYHGGHLIDVDILPQKMKSFLDSNELLFNEVINAYQNKLK